MRVRLNIYERALLRISRVLTDLSFMIGDVLHRKYDPNGVYNTRTSDKKCSEIVFSYKEES